MQQPKGEGNAGPTFGDDGEMLLSAATMIDAAITDSVSRLGSHAYIPSTRSLTCIA